MPSSSSRHCSVLGLSNPWWNMLLFIATLISVMFTGATLSPDLSADAFTIRSLQDILDLIAERVCRLP